MAKKIHAFHLFLILALVGLAAAACATTHVVATSGQLITAVQAAVEDDVIEFLPGTYHWADGVMIDTGITLRSQSGSAADVVIRLDYLTQGIADLAGFQGDRALRWEGLTLQQYGADVPLLGMNADLHFAGCTILDNVTGSDLIVANGGLLVDDCLVQGNQAEAVFRGNGATELTGCLLQGNTTNLAVILLDYGSLEMSGCSLLGNNGRLVWTAPMTVSVSNCLAMDNAGAGGFDFLFQCEVTMTDCTVRSNQFYDGGIRLGGLSQASFYQCDIIDNGWHDGTIIGCQGVVFTCCEVSMADWMVAGSTYSVDNDGCGVANVPVTLDAVKARFR